MMPQLIIPYNPPEQFHNPLAFNHPRSNHQPIINVKTYLESRKYHQCTFYSKISSYFSQKQSPWCHHFSRGPQPGHCKPRCWQLHNLLLRPSSPWHVVHIDLTNCQVPRCHGGRKRMGWSCCFLGFWGFLSGIQLYLLKGSVFLASFLPWFGVLSTFSDSVWIHNDGNSRIQ